MKARFLLIGAFPVLSFATLNCGNGTFCEGAACGVEDGGPSGDGGPSDATVHDGGAGDARADGDAMNQGDTYVPPAGCITTMDISPQAACVTEENGLFVKAGAASTGANGTKAAPYPTVMAAVGAATSAKPNIFVCAGTYDEQVIISANVNLYGGFACSDWSYSQSDIPKISPSADGYALALKSVLSATFEDLEFDSMAPTEVGASSIAVFAANTTAAVFSRIVIHAGAAGPQPSMPAGSSNYTGATAGSGTASTGTTYVMQQTCPSCLIATTPSLGGFSGGAEAEGSPGGDGGPAIPVTAGGAGGQPGSCSGVGAGETGAPSPNAGGGTGASVLGSLTTTGWAPAAGAAGSTATVAQGGGGGAGGSAGAGGGGGCGGCGGAGGAGGTGGGSSFAVLSYQSSLTFHSCTFVAAAPSAGGDGADGQAGQQGGLGGGISVASGCTGGAGGIGGSGGGGGGGAAGVSVDVAFVGNAPTVGADSTTTFVLAAATGGAPGAKGNPAATPGRSVGGVAILDLSK